MSARLKNLYACARRFVQGDDGPSAVEYAVLLALIVVVAGAAIRAVGESVHGLWQAIDTAIQQG